MKVSNPIALMRGVLDLFLAQPFGQKSLAQRLDFDNILLFINILHLLIFTLLSYRILSINLSESLKELDKDIKILEDDINDEEVCQKLRNYVYASGETQAIVKNEANGGGM